MSRLHSTDMQIRRPRRSSTTLLGAALLGLALYSVPSAAIHAQTFTVLDTTGGAAPQTTFSIFGTGGLSISSAQFVGPQFTLAQRSILTNIEAFVNNCGIITEYVPQCPGTLPLVVQIRRAVDGRPDPRLVIAATPLSHDNDPLTVSLEHADLKDVPLEPGTYFALFSPQQESDVGILLANANSGGFFAAATTVGIVTPTASSAETNIVAVRITARVVHQPAHPPQSSS